MHIFVLHLNKLYTMLKSYSQLASVITLLVWLHAIPEASSQSPDLEISDDRIGLVQSVVVDVEGRLYVGDLLNLTIHRYGPDGSYIGSFGRPGEGPGEFEGLIGLALSSDGRLLALDPDLQRITSFSVSEDDDHSTIPLPPLNGMIGVTGTLVTGLNGLWMDGENRPIILTQQPARPGGEQQQQDALYRLHDDGSAEKVTEVVAMELLILENGGFSAGPMPFGERPVVAVSPKGHLLTGSTTRIALHRIDDEGERQLHVDHDMERAPIDESLVRRALEREGAEEELERFAEVMARVPQHMPALEHIALDSRNRVWVAVNTLEALEEGRTHYKVFDSDGALSHAVDLEGVVMLQAVTHTHAYGLTTDARGAQSVVRYELEVLLER